MTSMSNMFPLWLSALTTLPHGNPNGGEFQGYRIPAGSMVMVDLRSVHMQPDLWENPDRFHPPRFIQDDGSINRKLPLLAFGMGEDYANDRGADYVSDGGEDYVNDRGADYVNDKR